VTLTLEQAKSRFAYCPKEGVLRSALTGNEVGYDWISAAGKPYRKVKVKGRIYRVHRIVWLLMTGEWPTQEIDHEDGNGLNNCWRNLRQVTSQVNNQNNRLYSSNRSGHPGVRWRKDVGKWVAVIDVSGRRIALGHFTEKDEAIAARKAAEVTHGFHSNHGSVRPL